jgi:hypothetical protein
MNIAMPPLAVQKEIVDSIELELSYVNTAKNMNDIYLRKSTSTIAKLWSE